MDLSDIISQVIGIGKEEITEETCPATNGSWTSMKHIALISAVQTTYKVKFSLNEVKQLRNVGAFLEILRKKGVSNIKI